MSKYNNAYLPPHPVGDGTDNNIEDLGPRASYALDNTTGCDTPQEMGFRFFAECLCEAFSRLQSSHITTTITKP